MHATGSARSPLDQSALQAAAGPPWTVQLHAAANSTNALAAADPVRNRVVVTDHQQAGRGRLDRRWVTPPGAALTFSAVVDPVVDVEWWPLLPLVAGYAVARVLRGSLKWPNDVLLGDRKVCGVLVERVHVRAHGTEKPLAVIGIGINVDQTAAELPVPTATSLALTGHPVDRTELFGEVLGHLHAFLGMLARSPHGFLANYRPMCTTLGADVRVELPNGRAVKGRAFDLDDHGRLLVESGSGVVPVAAGDVVHVHPTPSAKRE
jgi:BirA family biotin operon repressor/biotin-[acetyl-CoA-carboxylase] ligase